MVKKLLIIIIFLTVIGGCSNKKYEGTIEYSAPVVDDLLNIEIDAPIVIREVEMVQYYKDENNQVRQVFANYPIESFDEYINPDFPENLNSLVLNSDLKLNNLVLSDEIIDLIAYSKNVNKIKYQCKKEDVINNLDLILYEGSYASSGNDWKIGDIKITYYYVDKNTILSVTGSVRDNTLNATNNSIVEVIN